MTPSKKVLITLHEDLYIKLQLAAKQDKRSTTNFIEVRLQELYPDCKPRGIF
jgi:hypothetical protein